MSTTVQLLTPKDSHPSHMQIMFIPSQGFQKFQPIRESTHLKFLYFPYIKSFRSHYLIKLSFKSWKYLVFENYTVWAHSSFMGNILPFHEG